MVQKDKHKIMAIGISILLSLMLWIYVMGEKNPVQTRVFDNVKVSLENTDYISRSNLVILPNQDYTISITVSGRVKDLITARGEDFKLEADMSGYIKKGDNDIPVKVKSLPRGVEINESEIPKVKIKLDTLATRYVPVSIATKGTAKNGYQHVTPVAEPSGVMISGPKSYVDEVNKVIGKIDISGLQNNTTKTIAVEPVNSEEKLITNVSIEPKFVDVTVNVKPSKEVPIVVKTAGTPGEGIVFEEVKSKVSTVKIIGNKETLSKIKAIETESFDISTIKDTVTKEINLIIPDGISVQSDIKSVGVEFKVSKKVQKDFNIPLTITGKKENNNYEVSNSTVNVKISATEDVLSDISVDNITASIDVSSLLEGETTLQVKTDVKGQGEVSATVPDKVIVKVSSKVINSTE